MSYPIIVNGKTFTIHDTAEKTCLYVGHETSDRIAANIAKEGYIKSNHCRYADRYYDARLTEERAPSVTWLSASPLGKGSPYPRGWTGPKRRLLMPADYLGLSDPTKFQMFLVNMTFHKHFAPVQVHILFIRPWDKKRTFCERVMEKLDPSTFPLFRWCAQTQHWKCPAGAAVSTPDAPDDKRTCIVNLAIAEHVPWSDGHETKRLADVYNDISRGIPPSPCVVRAPAIDQRMCRCCFGKPCIPRPGEVDVFHDYAVGGSPSLVQHQGLRQRRGVPMEGHQAT